MSSDISVTINPPAQIGVTIAEGIPKHAATHAPEASDSLANYYVTGSVVRPSETGVFLTTGQTGNFITQSQTGQFVSTGNTGSFISTSQTGQFVGTGQTGHYTGVFYPYTANPNGYVQGSVVRPSNTGAFLDTGSSQTINSLKNFLVRPTVNGTGVLLSGEAAGAANTGSLTGVFYPLNSNPSGYITGVDLSAYVTGSVVRPSETGSFITASQTGAFYPSSNPSGFITGVDLSSYVTTGQTGQFITGSVVRPSETGNFVTASQTGQFVATGSTGAFLTTGAADGRYVSLTGNQDVSGLKDFQTRPTVTDIPVLISGDPVDTVHLYGKNDQGSTIYKGQPVYIGGANGTNPLIKIAANTGEFSSSKTIGLLAQDLLVNELGYVITEGTLEGFDTSAGNAGDPMWLGPTGNILYGTGNKPYGLNNLVYLGVVLRSQSSNGKVYVQIQNGFEMEELHNVYAVNPTNKDSLLYNSSSGAWFARQISTGDVSGISAYALAANTGSFITTGQTGQFVWTGSTGSFVVSSATGAFLTTGAADGRYALQSATGAFVVTGQTGAFADAAGTGAFLTTGAADGRYALQSATGAFVVTGQTGAFADAAGTGAFLTTGAADGRYYSLSNGQSISGFATTGFNNAITGMTITGDTTKVITLFQRGGTTVTGSFTDNAGTSGGASGFVPIVSYNRWQITGGTGLVYSITGAQSSPSAAYRVTVNSVIQDTALYTIDASGDTITFLAAPPSGADIIVIETAISGTTGSTGSSAGGSSNVWIPASAWIPRTTSGCGVDSRELATNFQNFDDLSFDAASNEFAQALTIMPNNYNNGTITSRFYWTASTGSGVVIWGIQGRAYADDDALDAAFGTAQTVSDTLITINDMHVTAATSAVTLTGTPAANRPVQFQIYRDASATGDTLSNDARLLGVEILYTSA